MYEKQITLAELQKIELEMLLQLRTVCEKHNLRYYIDGGTLLGSYCYGGFIPWDDDIDIKMPRKDYEKLLEYRHEFPDYISISPPEEDGYSYTFTKINDERTVLIENAGLYNEHIGSVYLDILPMDGHPKNKLLVRNIEKYKTLFHESKNGFNNLKKSNQIFKRIKGLLYDLLYNPQNTYQRLTRMAKMTDYDRAEFVGLLIEGNKKRETFSKKSLDDYVLLSFEGYKFPASSDYEQHLVNFYGEHILKAKGNCNLPYIPSPHNHEVFWKENSCQN